MYLPEQSATETEMLQTHHEPVSKYHRTWRKAVTGSSFAIDRKIGAWRNENDATVEAVDRATRGPSKAARLTMLGKMLMEDIVRNVIA